MTTSTTLYEFTPKGLAVFRLAFQGKLNEAAVNLGDREIATPIAGTGPFLVEDFSTAKEMAGSVIKALGSHGIGSMLSRAGLWAWLAFVLRDVLFPKREQGKTGETHRWYPSDPGDYLKAQRHLVRMPVVLLSELGDAADHLLSDLPRILPDIREQLTGQQDMLYPAFQAVARRLYFDDVTGKVKRGAGSKGAGSPRRLRDIRKQFDVTWDLFDLPSDRLYDLLPREFDRFKQTP